MLNKLARVFVLLLLCSHANANPANQHSISSQPDPIIQLKNGLVRGIEQHNVLAFKGIPYAQPPVGKLRWHPPKPPEDWTGVRDATHFDNQCMQKYIYDDMRFRSKGTSEDCLYLNIWTPAVDTDSLAPVLVYFYGGGFRAGDGSEPRYDGAAMAGNGITMVTVNYRLGMFGLFAHPELSAQSDYSGSGNYTFLDQHAALQWVVNNIRQFGGDPKRITIAGESAGAMSVSALMASPLSKHLFSAAIAQSGAILGPPLPAVSLKHAHQTGIDAVLKLSEYFNLKPNHKLEQLRQIPADKLLNAVEELQINSFDPTVDGLFFPESPQQLYQKGHFADVPVLAGVNTQESSYQHFLKNQPATQATYQKVIEDMYGADAKQVLALYPASTPTQIKDALQDLASDQFISFGTWNWLDTVTQKGSQPSYYYCYDHIRPARKISEGGSGEHSDRGAVHSAEIEYLLGNLDNNPLYAWQEIDYRVSKLMQSMFVQFIKFHDPNADNLPHWPQFKTGKRLLIGSDGSVVLSNEQLSKRYQFHRQYYKKSLAN